MVKKILPPDYIFEVSWEVCNKVGGIYTVLSSRAKTLQDLLPDRVIFVGPDLWKEKANPLFIESKQLLGSWRRLAKNQDRLSVRVGRWNIPGSPIVLLVDYQSFYEQKNEIYTDMWNRFQVDSLHAYGDYDEACMFGYAAGKVIESFYHARVKDTEKVILQAHEWMTGMTLLYARAYLPQMATIFTTHATSIGRSIASNGKPLYDYLPGYFGDQMAQELNMQSKHSLEKQSAHYADCFTTVSCITDMECSQLLEKSVDVVLPNGFEDDFVPDEYNFARKRAHAREVLCRLGNCMLGQTFDPDNTLIVATSGRYEFQNKGINVFLGALAQLKNSSDLEQPVLAFINVPAWVAEPRQDVKERMISGVGFQSALPNPNITHWLYNMGQDQILNTMHGLGLENAPHDLVKVIFVPCYLDGNDGVLNTSYYDLLIGQDLSVYASYYEPWGYTPLESIAFKVPTITTDLAGFGQWAKSNGWSKLSSGVEVIHRSDYNYNEVVNAISDSIVYFAGLETPEIEQIRNHASEIASMAHWEKFIKYYEEAYQFALEKAKGRT